MQSTYRFKSPVFASFTRDGHTREEAMRYITVRGPIAASIGDPVDGDVRNAPDKVRSLMRQLDLVGHDDEEVFRFFSYGDIDRAVSDAYRAAYWRAADFIWGKNQINDPAATCPRGFDASSEAEAKARMMAAVGFNFEAPDQDEELDA